MTAARGAGLKARLSFVRTLFIGSEKQYQR